MMSEKPYSNRELDHHFTEIKDILNRIEVQVNKTNGRVTKAEADITTLKTSGRIANWAFGLTIPIIISMGIWIFFNQLQAIKDELKMHEEGDKAKWEIVFTKLNLK